MAARTLTVDSSNHFSNTAAFIDDCFASDVRDYDFVRQAIENSRLEYDFAGSKNRPLILGSWLAAWQQATGAAKYDANAYARCPATDCALLAFLAAYIKDNSANGRLELCYPDIKANPDFDAEATDIRSYVSSGYKHHPFLTSEGAWNYGIITSDGHTGHGSDEDATVAQFLTYLYLGAHFVFISAPEDNGGTSDIQSLSEAAGKATGLKWSTAISSHYGGPNKGKYYLDIDGDAEPSNNPLICALLIDTTADGTSPNTFMQLEGWQWHFPYSRWHSKDYDSHKKCLWNFSTFATSPYSEKRSTPIFIAGPNFDLTLDANTHMPAYAGATKVESWMHPDLLVLS